MDAQQLLETEAAAFRHLLKHLQERSDVQNIDLMNLAGFCRNCLAKWLVAASSELPEGGLNEGAAKELVYGMPYAEWKRLNQR